MQFLSTKLIWTWKNKLWTDVTQIKSVSSRFVKGAMLTLTIAFDAEITASVLGLGKSDLF